MIEHALSAIYNIPHGAGLSIVIPAWMKWYRMQAPQQFERFAHVIFRKEKGDEGIEALERWFACINSPIRLGEIGVGAGDIRRIAENAAQLAKLWGIGELYTSKTIGEILHLAL